MCDQDLTDEEREHRPTGPVAFVDELVVALTNGRIFSREHPRVQSSLESLHESLLDMLGHTRGATVVLGAAEGFVFFDRRPLLGASMAAQRIQQPLRELESGGLAFDPKTTLDELHTFVHFLGRESGKVEHYIEANRTLVQKGCSSIQFLPPYQEDANSWADAVDKQLNAGPGGGGRGGDGTGGGSPGGDSASEKGNGSVAGIGTGFGTGGGVGDGGGLELDLDFNLPLRLYQDVVGVMQDAMLDACSGGDLDTSTASGMVESILKQLTSDSSSLMRMARYEKYDAFTFGHSIRVCFIALNFARHLTDDEPVLQRIGMAALMHDIGKARVPFDILHSTGRLSDEDRLEINMHTVHGGQILLEGSTPDPLAVAVAFSHHQNGDGSGYPNSVRGGRQSAATMVVKIADVYEALTAMRPYKPPMPTVRAYRIMMDMNGNFEPSLLRRFIEVNGIYPVGSRVRLSNGETARVEALTDTPKAPIVVPETSSDEPHLIRRHVEPVDLRESEHEIVEAVPDAAA